MNSDALWRGEVSQRLEASAKSQEQTAVTMERVLGLINVLDTRVKSLEGAPGTSRANINTIATVLGVLLVPAVCVGGPIVGALVVKFFELLAK